MSTPFQLGMCKVLQGCSIQPGAMPADHCGRTHIAQVGGLGMCVAMRRGIQKCTRKHVTRTVGVHRTGYRRWHIYPAPTIQHGTTFGAPGDANRCGQLRHGGLNDGPVS